MTIPRQRKAPRRHWRLPPGKHGGSSSLEPTRTLGTGPLTPGQLSQVERCASKITYTCHAVAQTAAIAFGWAGVEVHPYRCPVCDLWHVTRTRSD